MNFQCLYMIFQSYPAHKSKYCGDLAELPMYGILVQSPSFAEAPLGPRGAAGAECSERSESGRPSSPEELHSYFNLILVVFL